MTDVCSVRLSINNFQYLESFSDCQSSNIWSILREQLTNHQDQDLESFKSIFSEGLMAWAACDARDASPDTYPTRGTSSPAAHIR